VNARLKEVFPILFGGGFAELTLQDNDTLNGGVVLMARPPGKKNASISQLSGGEKALTALSLVFSIFELNPAPFCMLDEVDAPLDDLNTQRLINMVEEMSKTIQFIFITHNKVSMERSDHLMGITMQEAGVSRLVSVDVNQALELANTD
jgi:chromosome segregation protein